MQADVGEPEQMQSMFAQVDDAFSPLTAPENSAGLTGPDCRFESFTRADLEQVMRLNLLGLMYWRIKCRSKPNTDALREAKIDAHRAFLDGYPKVTWYSGPLFSDDNNNAIGSLRLIDFANRQSALAYINDDPYTRADIFETINIERWRPGLDVRQRDYKRKSGTMQFVIHCHDKAYGARRRFNTAPSRTSWRVAQPFTIPCGGESRGGGHRFD